MNKLKFFKTLEGEKHLKYKRDLSRFYFSINQEPKSKKSITDPEKFDFQNAVLKYLKKNKKGAYRSNLILEIDFTSTIDNPPSIQSLAKNYLDLLEKEIIKINNKQKKLLYTNDKKIQILFVNHHINFRTEKPSIRICADKIVNFISDLELINKYNLLGDDDYISNDLFCNKQFLKSIINDKKNIIKKFGEDYYRQKKDLAVKSVQEEYLEINGLEPFQLIILFLHLFNNDQKFSLYNGEFEKIFSTLRKNIISSSFPIKTVCLPQRGKKRGEGKNIFKEQIISALSNFKKNYSILFPLKHVPVLTILYTPPKGQIIDLDNLVKLIIPSIENLLKISKTAKNVIKKYQIIRIPRKKDDPHDGIVKILFSSSMIYRSIWNKVDEIVNKRFDNLD